MSTHGNLRKLDFVKVRQMLGEAPAASVVCAKPKLDDSTSLSTEKQPLSYVIANGQLVSNSEVVTSTEAKAAALLAVMGSYPQDTQRAIANKLDRCAVDNPDVEEAARCIHSARMHNVLTNVLQKRVITVPENVSSDMERLLSEQFLSYKIRVTFSKNVTHNNAAALRRVLRHYMRDVVGYRKDNGIPDGYDAQLCDVGSNGFDILTEELVGVHACMPDLDFRDHIRLERYKHFLYSHICPNSKDHRVICDGLREGSTLYRCENIGQHCNIRAPLLTFVHSAYDITAAGIVDCMVASNAHRAIMCLHFDSAMLNGETSGVNKLLNYKWDIISVKGVKYYQQKFLNDTQAAYVHRLDVYLDKFFTKVVLGSDKRFYMFEITEIVCGVAIIEVFRRDKEFIAGSRLTFNIPRTAPSGTVTIHTWEYNTGYESFFRSRSSINSAVMKPVSITLSEEYFLTLFKYGLTVDPNKFIYDGLLKSGVGLSARRNLGGTTIVSTDYDIPVRKLTTIVVAVYMLLYSEKWEATQGLVTIKNLVDQYRAKSSSSGLVRFFTNMMSSKGHNIVHPSNDTNLDHIKTSLMVDPRIISKQFDLSDDERERVGGFNSIIEWFVNFSRVKQRCPVVVHDSSHSVEYIVDVPDMVVLNIKSIRDETTLGHLCHIDYDDYTTPLVVDYSEKHVCDTPLQHISVAGDGNCLYNCFVKAGLYRGITVCDLKARLRDSPFFYEVDKLATDEGDTEFVDSLHRDGVFGNKFTLMLIAKTFYINICVHLVFRETTFMRFTGNKGSRYIHLQLRDQHYDLLIPHVKTGLVDQVIVSCGALAMQISSDSTKNRLDTLYKVYSVDGTLSKYRNVFCNVFKGPFIDLREMRYMELINAVGLCQRHSNKFLITDANMHKSIRALRAYDPSSIVVAMRCTNNRKPNDRLGVCDFTMDSSFHEESFCLSTVLADVLDIGVYSQCNLTIADLSRVSDMSYSVYMRTRTSEAERFNKIYLTWAALSSGGVAIYKIFCPEQIVESLNLISSLFEDIRFYRPHVTPTSAVEGFLICSGKRHSQGKPFSILTEVSECFYKVHIDNYCVNALGESEAQKFAKDLCGFYSGGSNFRSSRKHSHNRSYIVDRSLVVSKFLSYVNTASFGVFCNRFSSYKLHVGVDRDLQFHSRELDALLDSKCLHCESRFLKFPDLKDIGQFDNIVTETTFNYLQYFDNCNDFSSILSFIVYIIRGGFSNICVVSNCFLNEKVLTSFLAFCRCFKFVEICLRLWQDNLVMMISCKDNWYGPLDGDFELISCNRREFCTDFVKTMLEHAKLKARFNDKSDAIRTKADAIRLGLSIGKFNPKCQIKSDLDKFPKFKPQIKLHNTDALINSIKQIVGGNNKLSSLAQPNKEVEFIPVEHPQDMGKRLASIFEFEKYMEAELAHSSSTISKAVDNLLSFTTTRDPKRLNELWFPNRSFYTDQKKLKDGIGIFAATGKILKNSEPIVCADDINAVFDLVTGSVVLKSDYLKMYRGRSVDQVGGFAIYTNLVAHNQVEPMLHAISDVTSREHRLDFVRTISVDWIQAVAGAGKTTLLVETFTPNDIVVCPTVENRDSLRRKLANAYSDLKGDEISSRVRTLNGFLVDHNSKIGKISAGLVSESSRLLIDEAIMYHAGCLFALCSLFGINRMFCVGDKRQIPFISRINFSLRYEKLSDFVTSQAKPLARTFRSPPDVTYLMQKIYDKDLDGLTIKCLSSNQTCQKTISKHIVSKNCNFNYDLLKKHFPGERCTFEENKIKLLFFLREDMLSFLLNGGERYSQYCCTVHQFQGSDAEYILVFRLTYPEKSIFMDDRQCLVALTRHTKKLCYVSVNEADDVLSKWIKIDVTEADLKAHLKLSGGGPTKPNNFVSYRSIPPVELMHGDKCTRVGFSGRNDIILGKKDTLPVLLEKLQNQPIKGNNLVFSSLVLDKFSQQRLKPAVYAAVGRNVNLFCSGKNQNISSTVFEVMQLNAVEHIPDSTIIPFYEDEFEEIHFPRLKTIELDGPILKSYSLEDKFMTLQNFLSSTFPNSCYVNNSMDAWITYNLDLDLAIDDVSINTVKFATVSRTYDCMIPRLSFCSPVVRKACLVESLIAVQKRNRNVPQLSSTVSPYKMADELFDAFISLLDNRYYRTVHYGPAELAAWLNDQKGSVVQEVLGEHSIYSTAVENYSLITKSNPKPTLTDEAYMEFAAPQVVLHQTKDINAVFCVIFRSLKSIVKDMLRHHKNIVFFADMDPDDMAEHLTKYVSTKVFRTKSSLEIDIKKYDKSQDLAVLLLECKVMEHFGVPSELIHIWFHSHVESTVKDSRNGLKFKLQVQRRSGDGGTFFGNTMFLMAVMACNFDLESLDIALFSGDDSLLVGDKNLLNCDSRNFSDLYNLDVKFFPNFEYYHFCSKFLFPVGDRWYFIPDPVKLCVRLARYDLVNWTHIEEYRISLLDSTKHFVDQEVLIELALAVQDRYPVFMDPKEVFEVIRVLVQDPVDFASLFEEPPEMLPNTIHIPLDR
nr:MAG: replication-associated protein [Citrus leprosis virus C2]